VKGKLSKKPSDERGKIGVKKDELRGTIVSLV